MCGGSFKGCSRAGSQLGVLAGDLRSSPVGLLEEMPGLPHSMEAGLHSQMLQGDRDEKLPISWRLGLDSNPASFLLCSIGQAVTEAVPVKERG